MTNLTPDQPDWRTLVDLLRDRAQHQPDAYAYTFLADGETQERHITYAELDRQARSLAVQLQKLHQTNQRVLLLYPYGLHYIIAFFGCLYAGAIAVPTYPPRNNRSLERLVAIVKDAEATLVLTTAQVLENFERGSEREQESAAAELAHLTWLTTDTVDTSQAQQWFIPHSDSASLAFLQYTSGSTSQPRGVMVSHGNLLHNAQTLKCAFDQPDDAVMVSWLPLFHDMGLIGNILQSLYAGYRCVMLSPVAFLQKPMRWLIAISRYGATVSGAPNFAYELCTRRATPEQIAALDLSRWSVAFNGAEPVRADTLQRFAQTFAPCGFRPEAAFPCYGLAEATLFVTGEIKTAPPVLLPVQAAPLTGGYVVVADSVESEGTTMAVGCGQTWLDTEVTIVDPDTCIPCTPDRVGEIWISGPSVAGGYWNRPEQSEQEFRARLATDATNGPFLRTGDLGFVYDNELFITGRIKDLIIIRGRNHYPQDIELTAQQSHPDLRPDGGAAFTIDHEGIEHLVIAQEVERSAMANLQIEEIATTMRQAVAEHHGIQLYGVVLLRTNGLPKTSSGKVQRHACRQGFLDGTLKMLSSHILSDQDIQPVYADRAISCNRECVLATEPSQRHALVCDSIKAQVCYVLSIASTDLDVTQPLSTYGLDSLMVVEIKQQIEAAMGIALPGASQFVGMNLNQLATYILESLTGTPSDDSEDNTTQEVDQLSDEQVETMLREMMDGDITIS